MITILDTETTFQGKWQSDTSDPTPYNPENKLVSVQYKTSLGQKEFLTFYHKEGNRKDFLINVEKLKKVLKDTKLLVGHNLKFDLLWLKACGFKYEGQCFDTMIFEYVKAQGLRTELSLKATVERYQLSSKKDILDEYCGKQGLNVNEVPLDKLIEYGMGDIDITSDLYKLQTALLKTNPVLASTIPAIKLMNEFLPVLVDMEYAGVSIDIEALDKVEAEFKLEYEALEERLKVMVGEVMGHTPINLSSPEQMSWVLYGLKVKDKKKWAEIFNLGTEERNGVIKRKYTKQYGDGEFKAIIKSESAPVFRTVASQCSRCGGTGYIQRFNKDGGARKNKNICHTCSRTGIIYTETVQRAGFRIIPISSEYASEGGFSSGKETIDDLLLTNISKDAKEFLTAYKRYNAISTYLTSFVEGIRKNIRKTGLLHCSLNQTITATGRLSSTKPNLQNQPRSKTFPIRKVFKSRFKNGKILEVDWSGLEFRTAVALSRDAQGKLDIDNKADIHQFTADTITKYGQPTDRQTAKAHTFKPLFAGMSGTDAEIKYYEEFNKKYEGIHVWQESLVELALKNKYIQSPSGRIYAFPYVKRLKHNRVVNQTQIYNYIIQGFATGDLMPCTLIDLNKALKGYKSIAVLTVHDSVLIDVHPDELDTIPKIVFDCFDNIHKHLKDRFNFESIVKFAYEAKLGDNWLEGKEFHL
jgi:DNA polymerase I-like protein with 3'-5' exonuclease and polymerase domains